MRTREQYRRELQSTPDIQTVVKTMKATAAVGIQQFGQAAESLDHYEQTVHLALRAWLLNRPPGAQPPQVESRALKTGILVFGSEQGMCGQFNQTISRYAREQLSESGQTPDQAQVIALGYRSRYPLDSEGFRVEDTFPLPATRQGLTGSVEQVIVRLSDWRHRRDIQQILLFYNHLETKSSHRPVTVRLLPLDTDWLGRLREELWPTRQVPLYREDQKALFGNIVEQYLFTGLYRAFAHSLASENASRLMTMQAAEKNIGEHLQALQIAYNQFRQNQIDEELRDVIAGFEALTS